MQPVAHKFFPGAAFALRDLRLVMRENIVHAAAVDIDLRSEQRRRHRAALDVPARPARSPRRFPAHVAIGLVPRFPEREVADVFLLVLVVAACARWGAVRRDSGARAFRSPGNFESRK